MEVTKSNFEELLPEIEEAIKNASFVAIDAEFTGLNDGPPSNAYVKINQHYQNIKNNVINFLPIQFGLCVFKYIESTKSFTHQAYNFFLFPTRHHTSLAPDIKFLCQTSSIDFLSSNGFDFNKLFREGIPYLTNQSVEELKKYLKTQQDNRKLSNFDDFPKSKIPIPNELISVVQETCSKIEKFYCDDTTESNELMFPNLNSFVRKLIFQEMNAKFSKEKLILHSKVMPDKSYVLIAKKGQSKDDFETELCNQENKDLDNAIGFSTVIQMLVDHKACLVGHNMLLDVCHLVNRFMFNLPDDLNEFKTAVNLIFPRIFDTKVICSQAPLRDLITNSALEALLGIVQKPPFAPISVGTTLPGRGYSCSNKKCHEAGYDAYMTGLVFISVTSYLGTLAKPHIHHFLPDSTHLKHYQNKLFLMRLQDYPFLDLERAEPEPDRSNVFHVRCPTAWKNSRLADLFSKYGPISISWINDTSAFVALHKREHKSLVIQDLIIKDKKPGASKKDYIVMTYDYFDRKNNDVISSNLPTPKRKRTTSNESASGKSTKKQYNHRQSTPSISNSNKNGKIVRVNVRSVHWVWLFLPILVSLLYYMLK